MVELVLRVRCEHGRADDLIHAQSTVPGGCPGGRETVLDPERVAWDYGDTFIDFHTMAPIEQWRRIFDALTKEDE